MTYHIFVIEFQQNTYFSAHYFFINLKQEDGVKGC